MFLNFYIKKVTISKVKRYIGGNTYNMYNIQWFIINFMQNSLKNLWRQNIRNLNKGQLTGKEVHAAKKFRQN